MSLATVSTASTEQDSPEVSLRRLVAILDARLPSSSVGPAGDDAPDAYPTLPGAGTFTLKSIDDVLTWVEDEA